MIQRRSSPFRHDPLKSDGSPQLLLLAANLGGGTWGVSTYEMEEGGIVQAFALYFDAFFQSVVKVTPDLTYRVTPASRLAPETFRNHDRHGFNVYLQTAFAARQRWLLAGPDRRPLGFVRAPPGAFHTVCIFDGRGRATQGNRHKVARNIFIKGDTPVHVKTR